MRIESYLRNIAKSIPEKTALICKEGRWSYAEINLLSDRLSEKIQQKGFLPGDRALILLENSLASVVTLFAVLKADGTFSLINPQIKSFKLNFILKNSGAKIMVAEARLASLIEDSLSGLTELEFVVWAGGNSGNPVFSPMLSSYEQLYFEILIAASEQSLPHSRCGLMYNSDALATIIYTSGSTGDPKGVMCPHSAMDAAAQSIIGYLEMSSGDIVFVLLPLAFDYGLYQILMTFKVGGTVVLHRGFDYPQRIYQILKTENITVLPIVPTIADILLAKSRLEPLRDSSIRAITNTAALLTQKNILGLQALFPKAAIYAMYGLTECKRVSYLPPALINEKIGSVGIPMRGVSVRIADEHGNSLPPGKVGELLIHGPNVMQGYWKDPETTETVFQHDPDTGNVTLHSGDLFRQDEEGFLYFMARKDDMLKINGERAYPLEVEKVLQTMPEIREVAVLGLTNGNHMSFLVAAIVAHNVKSLSENKLRLFCREHLEPYLIPSEFIFINEIPKLPNGKIDKQHLKTICQKSDEGMVKELRIKFPLRASVNQ